MQAAQILAGYTLGGADLLRRAMGKKKVEEMQKQREAFVKGCAEKNQINAKDANSVFDLLEKFAGYGFNKSHAAAYAIVAYQTAYLKANHPVEFLCAMMTNDQADLAKLAQYIAEAKGFGIEVLGPDVNESDVSFAPASLSRTGGSPVKVGQAASLPGTDSGKLPELRDGQAGRPPRERIRFGLAAIKGVGEVAVQSILEARQAGGRFATLADLCERIDTRAVNKKVLECLIKAGACDALGPNRATLMALLDQSLARASSLAADKAKGQSSLFDAFDAAPKKKVEKPVVLPEWPTSERLSYEKELLGMYVSGHPFQPSLRLAERYATHTIEELASVPNRGMARVAGLVTGVQDGVSKKSGKKYAMVTIEDLTGTVQILAMNENYEKFRPLFAPNEALLITSEVSTGEDKPKLFPQDILRLNDAPRKLTKQVRLRFDIAKLDRAKLESVRSLVEAHRGPVPLFLALRFPGGEIAYLEPNNHFTVAPSVEFETALTEAFGDGTYSAIADRSLPERALRKWERKSDGDGD